MATNQDDERTVLLGQSQASVPPGDGEGPGLGDRIGPYRLEALLGEGGMGRVYRADQREPIRRQVALKLIRRQLAGGLAEAYFEVERQALARMDHPAIAKVYDAGRTAEGWPWFAMEFIDGEPLDAWRAAGKPDLRTRLRLLIALAFGVQHAHQRGMVHRDLKPNNILVTEVDGRPQPKLIDFGIAVGIDQDGISARQTGYERAGSGPYMSPEQYDLDGSGIDSRTDLYSLGVVMLGLLLPEPGLAALGEPPPVRAALSARLAASLQGADDPVLAAIPSELRWIVAKAVQPQREQRYATATALAEDIQRWLDGYAVAAVPATRGYRLRTFVRRCRRPLALVAAAVLALLAGLGAALYGLHQAEVQGRRSQATAGFLATVLSGVDPDQARDLDKTLMRQVLDQAAERAGSELADFPDALSDIESVISDSYMGLGEFERARTHAEKAWTLARQAHGDNDVHTLARARALGQALQEVGDHDAAEQLLRDTVARLQATRGDDDPLTLRARDTLGWLLHDRARFEEAQAELTDVVARSRRVLGDEHADTIESRLSLAAVLALRERFEEAIAELRDLVAVRTRLLGAEHPRTLAVRNSLSVALLQSRRYAEAEAELKDFLPISERVHGADSTMVYIALGNLAGSLRQQGKVAESGPYYQRVAEGFEQRLGPDHPRSIATRHNYGNYLFDAGELQAAYDTQALARERALAAFGERHTIIAETLHWQGRAAAALGRPEEARNLLERALAMKIELYGADSARLATTREALQALEGDPGATGAAQPGMPPR